MTLGIFPFNISIDSFFSTTTTSTSCCCFYALVRRGIYLNGVTNIPEREGDSAMFTQDNGPKFLILCFGVDPFYRCSRENHLSIHPFLLLLLLKLCGNNQIRRMELSGTLHCIALKRDKCERAITESDRAPFCAGPTAAAVLCTPIYRARLDQTSFVAFTISMKERTQLTHS